MKNGSNLSDKTNVDEEYKEAFRTKSYVEMWSQVHGFDKLTSTSSVANVHINLSEFLLKPRQETLNKIESLNVHHLLLDYFEAGLEAWNLCEVILKSIHQTRVYYQSIRKFRKIHENNLDLFRKLTLKLKKMRRKEKSKRISKQIGGLCLVISHTALVVALLILSFHSVFGIIAVPGLAALVICIRKKKKTRSSSHQQGPTRSLLERLGEQLDISAKGIYILINDFDTISRLVWRLHDEIEHRKAIANMCIGNGKIEVLKEVVREYCMHDSSFLEQLKELEEHTKLCFHTINRSRRHVIEEIVDSQP
ncbi:Single hybrid motif superfamily protein isoform 1 [Hibiscus syriacus]|uniref:Single hybrid motif superfamily protein isoform 1 n=1 Tax=Hibiscus syriacus TaxID=106335 RepID=A0A6A3CQE0_HIBSY|nr:Single hybrid motif superfamily protein isoform 1 [Hibiscus syriacus]